MQIIVFLEIRQPPEMFEHLLNFYLVIVSLSQHFMPVMIGLKYPVGILLPKTTSTLKRVDSGKRALKFQEP